MSQYNLFLDLDRTAFRTDIFSNEKWRLIASRYSQIDASTEVIRAKEFCVHSGELYAYDFTAHLQHLHLPIGEVYKLIMASTLGDGRLEHKGLASFVAWAKSHGSLTILTYGIDDYQRLKAALCPSLKDTLIVTTLEPKEEYFQQVETMDTWLIDDKLFHGGLPSNVNYVQACMGAASTTLSEVSWQVVTDLADIPIFLAR